MRDAYESELLRAFVALGKPVFGVCRGLQLMNVALAARSTRTSRPSCRRRARTAMRRSTTSCCTTSRCCRASVLSTVLGGQARVKVNSVHHQAIKTLAPGFVVEARSPDDGMIEAIRRPGDGYLAAVQWHPEFHRSALGTLDDRRS